MRKAEAASLAGAAFAWTARHSAVLPGVRMPMRRDLETTTEKGNTMKTALLSIAFAMTAGATFAQGPLPMAQPFTSTLSVAQVRAEAAEAQRLGVNNAGELTRVITPMQAEQIRQAGRNAADRVTAHRAGTMTN